MRGTFFMTTLPYSIFNKFPSAQEREVWKELYVEMNRDKKCCG